MTGHQQPDTPSVADIERFYSDLQAVGEASRTDAGIILPVADQQVERHREIVANLRQLLAQAEADLDRWAVTAAELRATVEGRDRDSTAVGGKALAEVAASVLDASGKPQPIHYTDLQELVRLAGYTISGKNPQATLLTALGRSKQFESIGGRTGFWKLAGQGDG